MFKKIGKIVIITALILAIAGCAKGGDANKIATKFNEDIRAGAAFTATHWYYETDETMDYYREVNGNTKIVFKYEDGTKEEVYLVNGNYAIYSEDTDITDQFSEEEKQALIDESLEVVLFYPEDALEVFDKDIDSNIIEENEKNAYLAYGQYDDSTSYYYYYGKMVASSSFRITMKRLRLYSMRPFR